jgi:predicted dehydrogenase
LQQAAQRRGVLVGMAYCLRFHPAYGLARKEILKGQIGRPLAADAWFDSFLPDWHPWEDYRQSYAARRDLGGGVLPTLDHEIDFLNWCFGQPVQVRGFTHRSPFLEADADDLARLDLRYAWRPGTGGEHEIDARIELSLSRQERRRGFLVRGEDGSIEFDMQDGRLTLYRDRGCQQILWDGRGYDINQMYLDLLSALLRAVSSGLPLPVPLEAGLAALEVMSEVDGLCGSAASAEGVQPASPGNGQAGRSRRVSIGASSCLSSQPLA